MRDHIICVTPTAFDPAEIVLVFRFKKKVWLKIKTRDHVRSMKIYFLQTNLDLMMSEVINACISLTLLNHHEGKIHLHMILKSIPLNIHFILSSGSSTEAQYCLHVVRLIQSFKLNGKNMRGELY